MTKDACFKEKFTRAENVRLMIWDCELSWCAACVGSPVRPGGEEGVHILSDVICALPKPSVCALVFKVGL